MAAGGLGSGTCAWEMAVIRSLGSKPLAPSSVLLKATEAGPMAVSLNNMFYDTMSHLKELAPYTLK